MFKEIYDMMIKTKVNDVHRTISTEDEYLEYSKLLASEDENEVDKFLFEKAKEMTSMDSIREKIEKILTPEEPEESEDLEEDIDIDKLNLDEILGKNTSSEDQKEEEEVEKVEEDTEKDENKEEAIEEEKPKRRVGRPRKEEKPKEKRRVGRPRKNK